MREPFRTNPTRLYTTQYEYTPNYETSVSPHIHQHTARENPQWIRAHRQQSHLQRDYRDWQKNTHATRPTDNDRFDVPPQPPSLL